MTLIRKAAAFAALLILSSQSYAAPSPFADLKAFQGLENGLWHWSFTTQPRQPAIPDHDERGCVDIARYMERAMQEVQKNAPQCVIQVERDTPEQAELSSQCPAMQIMPGLALPPLQIRYLVQRLGKNDVKVEAIAPNFLTGAGHITFLHQAQRLGACPRQ
ncbi:hypothetical protein [Kerstersia sp.]|uniref:hypothetical protein n=1 Tax=Kerstersia sp. TaxID=1930783 RepID=UPI003F8FF871